MFTNLFLNHKILIVELDISIYCREVHFTISKNHYQSEKDKFTVYFSPF